MRKTITHHILLWFAVFNVFTAMAQESDLRPISDTYAITKATIVQGPGRVIQNGTVLISNGLITQVGTSVSIPSNAIVIEADSMYVYPGFIDGLSQAGIPRPENEERPRDLLSMDPPNKWAGITPEISAADLIDGSDKTLTQLREAGFAITQSVPRGQMLPGKGALVILSGETANEMIYRTNSTQYAQLSGARGVFPSTVIGVMSKMRELYKNAENARTHSLNYAADPSGLARPEYSPALQALFPVVSKQMGITFEANDDLDISRVLTLKNELGFNLTIGNIEEGWNAINKLKASGANVLLSFDLPKEFKVDTAKEIKTDRDKEVAALEKRKEEAWKMYAAQAAEFHKAGIRFGFSSMSGSPGNLKKNLKIMIDNGLPEDAALAALTTNPASILGISNVAGTVDQGKLANLVVTTGPYFDDDSGIKYMFVDGNMYEYDARKKKQSQAGEGGPVVLAGTWNYTADDGEGESTGVLTFVDDGGSYSGTMTNSQVPVNLTISDVSISGNDVTFVATLSMDGQEFELEGSVVVNGNSMDGELITPFGNANLSAEKNPNN